MGKMRSGSQRFSDILKNTKSLQCLLRKYSLCLSRNGLFTHKQMLRFCSVRACAVCAVGTPGNADRRVSLVQMLAA